MQEVGNFIGEHALEIIAVIYFAWNLIARIKGTGDHDKTQDDRIKDLEKDFEKMHSDLNKLEGHFETYKSEFKNDIEKLSVKIDNLPNVILQLLNK